MLKKIFLLFCAAMMIFSAGCDAPKKHVWQKAERYRDSEYYNEEFYLERSEPALETEQRIISDMVERARTEGEEILKEVEQLRDSGAFDINTCTVYVLPVDGSSYFMVKPYEMGMSTGISHVDIYFTTNEEQRLIFSCGYDSPEMIHASSPECFLADGDMLYYLTDLGQVMRINPDGKTQTLLDGRKLSDDGQEYMPCSKMSSLSAENSTVTAHIDHYHNGKHFSSMHTIDVDTLK